MSVEELHDAVETHNEDISSSQSSEARNASRRSDNEVEIWKVSGSHSGRRKVFPAEERTQDSGSSIEECVTRNFKGKQKQKTGKPEQNQDGDGIAWDETAHNMHFQHRPRKVYLPSSPAALTRIDRGTI